MSVSNIANTIQAIRSSKDNDTQRKMIHTAARVSQIFFSLGCVISVVGMYLHLTPLLTGGSFLYNTIIIGLRAAEGLLCYDVAKISSNFASIISSPCIHDFFKKTISNADARALILPFIEKMEKTFVLPNDLLKNLNKPKNLSNAITHNTILAKSFNPQIENFLSR